MGKLTSMDGNSYYRIMGIILISIAVGGFSLHGLINQDTIPSPYPLLIFHAIVMAS